MDSRHYEVVFILDPSMSDDDIVAQINKVKEIIALHKGEIIKESNWGKRRLAYIIKKKTDAHYYYIRFSALTKDLKEFDRRFKLMESVIRFFVTVHDPIPLPDLTRPKLDKFSVGRRKVIPREITDVCLENIHEFNVDKFITDRGKIIPRRITRISSLNQRRAARVIKWARFLAIVPYIVETYR